MPQPGPQWLGSRRIAGEIGGAFGDLGTLLPYLLAVLGAGILAPLPVLTAFGCAYLASALIYRLPIPVQPMKVVGAVVLTQGLAAPEIAATGILLGLTLIALSATGAMDRIARLLPQSVIAGLQLGVGLSLGLLGLSLIGQGWWIGLAALAALLLLARVPAVPAALVVVVAATLTNLALGGAPSHAAAAAPAGLALPGIAAFGSALVVAAIPQLPLTLTNAVLVTASMAKDLAPGKSARVSPRRLALTSGAINLLFAPLGALPMCHGAGGLAAHWRFGARTGLAPALLGVVLLSLAALPAETSFSIIAAVPAPVLGALLVLAAVDLAISPRLYDALPSCLPVIVGTGIVTMAVNPAVGLIAGCLGEVVRKRLVRAYGRAEERPRI